MSELLQKAREYEAAREKQILPQDRPAFHLSPRAGWMNDPNGFCFYNGRYHLFYQYHPYRIVWDLMYWGHAVSTDLLHWDYLPAALAPDMPYDCAGCFSGSALTLPDGRHALYYTGVQKELCPDGIERDVQTQNIAVGDGINYTKYEGNPVLTDADLPDGGSRVDFRDPKAWQEADGTYRMLAANKNSFDGSQLLLFKSIDGFNWKFESIFDSNRDRIGKMWECPDFFFLDGKYILLSSAQDMLPQGLEYHNGNGNFYITGTFDEKTGQFREEGNHAIDCGIDFYAAQSVLTPDGRRVMIGWLQNWDTCSGYKPPVPWFGQMTVPRELSLRSDGILIQNPVREIENLRNNRVAYDDVIVENTETALPGVGGRCVDLTVEIEAADPRDLYRKFAVRFAKNETYHTDVSFRPAESVLKIDRKFAGSRRAIVHQRRAEVSHENGKIKLRLILDRFSAEIFVNDGEKVMTAAVFTEQEAREITFLAEGKAKIRVVKYDLDS